ncbi:MAG TPA: DUF899 family protein, partial [Bacillales bacterium]|nr:DUF899 family protein [Bacillales bacterium]
MKNQSFETRIADLEEEIAVKKKQLSELRRSVPKQEVGEYEFQSVEGGRVTLADLFHGKDQPV